MNVHKNGSAASASSASQRHQNHLTSASKFVPIAPNPSGPQFIYAADPAHPKSLLSSPPETTTGWTPPVGIAVATTGTGASNGGAANDIDNDGESSQVGQSNNTKTLDYSSSSSPAAAAATRANCTRPKMKRLRRQVHANENESEPESPSAPPLAENDESQSHNEEEKSSRIKKKRKMSEKQLRNYEAGFETNFQKLQQFKEEHGHVNIPTKEPRYNQLLNFVTRQKQSFARLQKGEEDVAMSASQIAKLMSLGVKLETKKYWSFDDRAKQWYDYKKEHGRDFPTTKGHAMRTWVCRTRERYLEFLRGESAKITQEQIDRLTSLGFKWPDPYDPPKKRAGNIPNKSWEQRFDELVEFKNQHGTTIVPQLGSALGRWVHDQRKGVKDFLTGKKSHITAQKYAKLNGIGFVLNAKTSEAKAEARAAGVSGLTRKKGIASSNNSKGNAVNKRRTTGQQQQSRRLPTKVTRNTCSHTNEQHAQACVGDENSPTSSTFDETAQDNQIT